MNGFWIGIGAISGLVSVILGAFGAHGLSGKISPHALEIWHTGAQYEMFHALALLALGVWISAVPAIGQSGAAQAAGWCFIVGTIVFSGSLYALALTDIKILGAITPIGGLSFIGGWILLAILAFRS